MQLAWPDHLSIERFLSDYWQKKPLVIRQAFPEQEYLINAAELAGLACETDIESRLISEQIGTHRWQLEHGPFSEDVFSELPESHWTLLVQDIDKHLPQAAGWLEHFAFLPRWRIDDIMVSYAADQGSVGPHTDSYDVFLLQLEGKRRWKISSQQFADADFLADSELKVVRDFICDEEWLLEAGDMLYLPPNIGHWGIAEGPCMTCSIGFNSPSMAELAGACAEGLLDSDTGQQHYQDPDISIPVDPGRIDDDSLSRVRQQLSATITNADIDSMASWFGRLVSEGKAHLDIEPSRYEMNTQQLRQKLTSNNQLSRHPWLKMFYRDTEQHARLFANGDEFVVDQQLAPLLQQLCRQQHYRFDAGWLENLESMALLTTLYNHGYLIEDDD